MQGDDEATYLQKAVRQAVADAGKARDHFDRLLQVRLETKGKPLYDIDRGKSKNPSRETLKAIAEVLGKPVHFFTGEEPYQLPIPIPSPLPDEGETAEIISLDLSLSMGPGTLIEEFPEEERVRISLAFIQAITRTPTDRLRLVRGIGESMEPTLRTGDRIIVDLNERQLSRSHGIYWVDHFGTHGLKRLRAASRSTVLIMSDNPNVPDFEADAEDVRILGRAIWFARDL